MQQVEPRIVNPGIKTFLDEQDKRKDKQALHEAIEIKCFYEGTTTLLIGSQTVVAKAGDVVVINPYEFHATVDVGEEQGSYHLFTVPLDYFAGVPELDFHKLLFLDGKVFQTLFAKDAQMYNLLMSAAQESEQEQTGSDVMIKSLLMAFFTLLLRRGITEAEYPADGRISLRQYNVVEPALRCIKNKYAENLTVEQLAKLCNLNKHYFCRAFKNVTQKSAMEYLRDFRLRVANTLILNTNKSVAEIAVFCGFESPNYFARCYKKKYGYPPRHNRMLNGEKI